MKNLILLSLLNLSGSLFASDENTEWFECVINDKDGYTFVRSGPGKEYAVIDTVFEGWFFYVYGDTAAAWLHTQNPNGKIGFAHKSRVQFFHRLDSIRQHDLIADAFKELVVVETGSDRNYRNKVYEGKFMPGYTAFRKVFCLKPDTALLILYFQTLAYTRNSVDEGNDWASATMWLCHPAKVKMSLCALSKTDRQYAITSIKMGMAMSGKEDDYTSQKLKEMYTELERPCD